MCASRASGGIGRRARFRSVCPKGRGGSTPPSRTCDWPRVLGSGASSIPTLCRQACGVPRCSVVAVAAAWSPHQRVGARLGHLSRIGMSGRSIRGHDFPPRVRRPPCTYADSPRRLQGVRASSTARRHSIAGRRGPLTECRRGVDSRAQVGERFVACCAGTRSVQDGRVAALTRTESARRASRAER